ncbi:MAG TPA: Mov34/MPN/PAD-1 family protein, partial [Micromonosporaceae bacterium]
MLTIDREIVDAIIAHARRDHPEEACGVIAGPIGSDRPVRHIPMDNAERSMTFYRFDAMEQLRVWREMDDL